MKKEPYDIMGQVAHPSNQKKAHFDEFEAMELYCPKCGRATPVSKSLLLVLPEGDKYEYRCQFCGTTVGDKMDRSGGVFAPPGS